MPNRLITFNRIGTETIEATCSECSHVNVCSSYEGMVGVSLPIPYFISFTCRHCAKVGS